MLQHPPVSRSPVSVAISVLVFPLPMGNVMNGSLKAILKRYRSNGGAVMKVLAAVAGACGVMYNRKLRLVLLVHLTFLVALSSASSFVSAWSEDRRAVRSVSLVFLLVLESAMAVI